MAFLTDRKRVRGLGSSRTGTEHHWSMTVSSWGLIVLVPLFVFTFAPILGQDHATVTDYFGRPFPAIVAGLMIVTGFMHFKNGVRMTIEDYVHGYMREFWIIAISVFCYAAAATGLFGPQTEDAVRSFQTSSGLPVTGRADTATLDALGFDTSAIPS